MAATSRPGCVCFGEDQELSHEGLPWSTRESTISKVFGSQDDRDLREERQKMGVENVAWKQFLSEISRRC